MPYSCISTRSIYDVPFGPTTDFVNTNLFPIKNQLVRKKDRSLDNNEFNFLWISICALKIQTTIGT